MIAWAKLVRAHRLDEKQKILNYALKGAWYFKNPNLKRLQIPLSLAGCERVADLYDETMHTLSYASFRTKYININFMDYASLVSSVPSGWKRQLSDLQSKPQVLDSDLHLKIILNPKTCKFAYQTFIEAMEVQKPHEKKWGELFPDISKEDWLGLNKLPFQCTRNTKFYAFQYKIIHRILGTRKSLKQYNIQDDDKCHRCPNDCETIAHLLTECPPVQYFWNELKNWVNTYMNMEMDARSIIFGNNNVGAVENLITLVAKYYIFLCSLRQQRPCLAGAQQLIRAEYTTERYIAKNNARLSKVFKEKWAPLRTWLEAEP